MSQKPRPPKTCPTCQTEFKGHRASQVYCSRECIKTSGKNYPVCPCGIKTQSYMQKYCCSEHRETYSQGKAPVRMETHVCQQCGESFDRPHFYPGKKMFCSIDCSNKQHSRKRARHYQFGNLNLNGSYELRFVACLERLSVTWEPWPDEEPLIFTVDDQRHSYTPDFRVAGMAVEIKGADDPDSLQPLARSQWSGCPLVVVNREGLGQLEHTFSQGKFIGTLKAMKSILKQAEQPENVGTVEAVLDGVNNGDQVANPTVVATVGESTA